MNSKLPPGWTTQLDPKSNKCFYIDTATGKTQWNPPPAPVVAAAPYSSHSTPTLPTLPPGWISQIDPQTKRTFYVNQATGKSSWQLPTGAAPNNNFSPAASNFTKVGSNFSTAPQIHGSDLSYANSNTQQPYGGALDHSAKLSSHNQGLGTSAGPAAVDSNPLPPGFITQLDKASGKYFFVDTRTGKSTWTDPRTKAPAKSHASGYPGANSASPKPNSGYPGQGAYSSTSIVASQQPIQPYSQAAQPHAFQPNPASQPSFNPYPAALPTRPAPATNDDPNINSLPPGFIMQLDKASGKYFFVDTTTGKSTWTDPRGATPSPKPFPPARPGTDRPVPVTPYQSNQNPYISPNLHDAGTLQFSTSPNSQSGISLESDRPYNSTCPIPVQPYSTSPSLQTGAPIHLDRPYSTSPSLQTGAPIQPIRPSNSPYEMNSASVQSYNAIPSKPTSDAPYQQIMSDSNSNPSSGRAPQAQQQRPASLIKDSPASPALQTLPPGFISAQDPTSGKTFFVNTITGKSQWNDPRESAKDIPAVKPLEFSPYKQAEVDAVPEIAYKPFDIASYKPVEAQPVEAVAATRPPPMPSRPNPQAVKLEDIHSSPPMLENNAVENEPSAPVQTTVQKIFQDEHISTPPPQYSEKIFEYNNVAVAGLEPSRPPLGLIEKDVSQLNTASSPLPLSTAKPRPYPEPEISQLANLSLTTPNDYGSQTTPRPVTSGLTKPLDYASSTVPRPGGKELEKPALPSRRPSIVGPPPSIARESEGATAGQFTVPLYEQDYSNPRQENINKVAPFSTVKPFIVYIIMDYMVSIFQLLPKMKDPSKSTLMELKYIVDTLTKNPKDMGMLGKEVQVRERMLALYLTELQAMRKNFDDNRKQFIAKLQFRVMRYLVAVHGDISKTGLQNVETEPEIVENIIRVIGTTQLNLRHFFGKTVFACLEIYENLILALSIKQYKLDYRFGVAFKESLTEILGAMCDAKPQQYWLDLFPPHYEKKSPHLSTKTYIMKGGRIFAWKETFKVPMEIEMKQPYSILLDKKEVVALGVYFQAVNAMASEARPSADLKEAILLSHSPESLETLWRSFGEERETMGEIKNKIKGYRTAMAALAAAQDNVAEKTSSSSGVGDGVEGAVGLNPRLHPIHNPNRVKNWDGSDDY